MGSRTGEGCAGSEMPCGNKHMMFMQREAELR
jgi:hypothetical protein